jgi:hypothetical protein
MRGSRDFIKTPFLVSDSSVSRHRPARIETKGPTIDSLPAVLYEGFFQKGGHMSRMMKILSLVFLGLIAACAANKSGYDGMYVFDEQGFQAAFDQESGHGTLPPDQKAMADQVMAGIMQEFRGFTLEIKDGSATATFQQDVTKAKIDVVSNDNGTIHLKMTPIDEARKAQVAMLTISGSKLTLDDGTPDSGKLYFVKK